MRDSAPEHTGHLKTSILKYYSNPVQLSGTFTINIDERTAKSLLRDMSPITETCYEGHYIAEGHDH